MRKYWAAGSKSVLKKFIILSLLLVFIIPVTVFVYYKLFQKPGNYGEKSVILPAGLSADSLVVFKSKRIMLLYNSGIARKTYNISLGRNTLGHKEKEGDKKTPEGNYRIDFKNPQSSYHLSIRISYPDEQDKQNAEAKGVSPGGDIMIHGLPNNALMPEEYYTETDWTDGCIAVTNEEIEELWKSVEVNTPVNIYK